MGITYRVIDVEGLVAAVSPMNDGGKTVWCFHHKDLGFATRPLKLVGSIDLKRENRTFWMGLPRAGTGGVQRMMALRREQPVERVEKIAGNL